MTEKDINRAVGKTVIHTISDNPPMHRVGIIIGSDGISEIDKYAKILWQPSPTFPVHNKPYVTLYAIEHPNIQIIE